jgi:hypothetical protein
MTLTTVERASSVSAAILVLLTQTSEPSSLALLASDSSTALQLELPQTFPRTSCSIAQLTPVSP